MVYQYHRYYLQKATPKVFVFWEWPPSSYLSQSSPELRFQPNWNQRWHSCKVNTACLQVGSFPPKWNKLSCFNNFHVKGSRRCSAVKLMVLDQEDQYTAGIFCSPDMCASWSYYLCVWYFNVWLKFIYKTHTSMSKLCVRCEIGQGNHWQTF